MAVVEPVWSEGRNRILVLGRTGSGKTTLARAVARSLGVPHIELDALYFNEDLSTVSTAALRERTRAAVARDRWVIDGNKTAVRDLVWPRADLVVWLDYPIWVSMWRLSRRAVWRTSKIARSEPDERGGDRSRLAQLTAAARGVVTALRSHRGQRRRYPALLAAPHHAHLEVIRLRSPRATRRWLEGVRAGVAEGA